MGIQSLLPFLADSTRETHISKFENEFVAIDAYCWLHKGIYSCAYELAMKQKNFQYVTYCMRYIEMLIHFNVKPILVFDGRPLSSKSETEKKRRQERKKKFEKGKELMRAGNTLEGKRLIGESVDVSHELALKLIEECRKRNIDCIVAPYEADAQLAFLSINKIVKCVITEDSDLLAYGSERVMFKLNLNNGRGKLIEKSELYLSLKMSPEEFSEDLFRYMCILSGCDYLPSLESIGPANALKFIKLLKGDNIYDALPKLPKYLNKMKAIVTPEYLVGFRIADNTFKHQLVYDPFQRLQVPLRPVENDDDIVGTKLPDDVAFDMAVGNIDPMTMKKLSNYDPDKTGKGFTLLWKTDSLPNATPRQSLSSFLNRMPEIKNRQNGHFESNTVKPAIDFKNNAKKQRTLCSTPSIRNLSTKEAGSKIPDCGFIFDPKIENKKGSSETNESNLLNSRYFSWGKDKGREKKRLIENANDRRKDESHEDYLQRLYNEYFPLGEESETKQAGYNCVPETEDFVSERFCSLCCKDKMNCTCLNENADASDVLSLADCTNDGEVVNKEKESSSDQHFLLDEIYKSQMEKAKEEKLNEEEEKQRKVSPSQSLSFNFSKILTKITETPKAENTEMAEKENAEALFIEEQESVRPSSPVFKLQRGGKVLKRNCRLGNISDTAGTPTSVYFSSSDSDGRNSFTPEMRRTPSNGKMPSVRSFNSVPSKGGKNSLKSSSVNRTLFQFGFKKRRRDENETEA